MVRFFTSIPWDLITLPPRQILLASWLSVCGSQVHSASAPASAHTLPDSLGPALKPTSLAQSLYAILGKSNSMLSICQVFKLKLKWWGRESTVVV